MNADSYDVSMAFVENRPDWFDPAGGALGHELAEFVRICELSSSVEGWLSPDQGSALYQLARRSVAGDVVEIGCLCGKSTVLLGLGCAQSTCRLYAIDPHKCHAEGGKEQWASDFSPRLRGSLDDFQQTLKCSRLNSIEVLVCTSEQARPLLRARPLKLVFIDGSHDYMDVVLDYYLWQDRVVVGGYLAFHDSNFNEVSQAIERHVDREQFEHEGTIGDGGWAMTLWRRRK